jgi:peptide-methionine (S)-S-oxide reductase
MVTYIRITLFAIMAIAAACSIVSSSSQNVKVTETAPTDAVEPEAEPQGMQTAVFAGGCFWGVEAVFEHVTGVKDARSGYAGGDARSANYDMVSEGRTDHAESVKVTYDPQKVSYAQLLNVFFTVAHDPTQLNRQGPDVGRHYRSAIFYVNEEQRAAAVAYIEELGRSGKYQIPIVTEIVPLKKFYDAEPYHQDFMRKNPRQPYIVEHDKPKIEDLRNKFPDLFVDKKYVKFDR